jgi:hypothetical protein
MGSDPQLRGNALERALVENEHAVYRAAVEEHPNLFSYRRLENAL